MATQNFAYDHPAYLQRYTGGGITTAGNAAVSNQFAAFTTMKAKSAQITQRVAALRKLLCQVHHHHGPRHGDDGHVCDWRHHEYHARQYVAGAG